jgi:hypothetical protein
MPADRRLTPLPQKGTMLLAASGHPFKKHLWFEVGVIHHQAQGGASSRPYREPSGLFSTKPLKFFNLY